MSINESRPYLWSELTEAEQREANFRGFERGADIRYIVKNGYRDGELMLVRWERVKPSSDAAPASGEEMIAQMERDVDGTTSHHVSVLDVQVYWDGEFEYYADRNFDAGSMTRAQAVEIMTARLAA